MVRKFRIAQDQPVEPWTLIFHQVEVLDAAAELAEQQGDIQSLVEISREIDQASRTLIEVYLMLSEDKEEPSDPGPKKIPIGFALEDDNEEVQECNCEEEE